MIKELTKREDFLNFVRGKGRGIVPCRISIIGSIYERNPQFFDDLIQDVPSVQISIARPEERAKEHIQKDQWQCVWHYPGNYLEGQVIEHPLNSWEKFSEYQPPSPDDYTDWESARKVIEEAKRKGNIAAGSVEHGFLYLKMTYIRGFENFMIDLAEKNKNLYLLRDMITHYWIEVVKKYVNMGVDVIYFGDDLGHQDSLPMKPTVWREFIKPAMKKIFDPCRENGIEVYLHTDGYIVDIIPDLIEIGVTILNPQDLVNGLDNLYKLAKDKVCIDLDIDRQKITVFGKPEDIDQHILRCIKTLGSPNGRLMLVYGAYEGTPKENIAQVAYSMEKYHNLWEN